MCGAGLSCIQHVCIICEEGVYDPSDGKMCYDGQWCAFSIEGTVAKLLTATPRTYSEWDTMSSDPQAVFLLVIVILFFVSITRPLFGTTANLFGHARQVAALTLLCAVRKGAWKKGYLFKLLRKNKKTKKLGKWLDNQTEMALNKLFRRSEREDSRRRRSGSIQLAQKDAVPRPALAEYAAEAVTLDLCSSLSFFGLSLPFLLQAGYDGELRRRRGE